MSEKRQVPTFKVYLTNQEVLEGPIVSPNKHEVAVHLGEFHDLLRERQAILVYAGKWVYAPLHAILKVERGSKLFTLPWPLRDE